MKKKLLTALLCATMLTTSTVTAFAADTSPNTNTGGNTNIEVKGTYQSGSTEGNTISVDIIWGSMEFTYKAGSTGTWNPGSHSYDGSVNAGGWTDKRVGITVKNHSDTAVTASFKFEANTEAKVTTTGTFYTLGIGEFEEVTGTAELKLPTAVGTTRNDENANEDTTPIDKIYFGVSGDGISENVTLGNIVVTITKKAE